MISIITINKIVMFIMFIYNHTLMSNRNILISYLTNPESNPLVISHSHSCIAISDYYPKSRLHWLVLPKERINNVYD